MAFPTTHWSLLVAATLNGDSAGRAAMEKMCARGAPTDSLVAVPDRRTIVATGNDGRLRVWAGPR